MARATCRCGQVLTFPDDGPDRVVCPKCSSRIRVRKAAPPAEEPGFLRFHCSCGRRLKVRDAKPRPVAGKCPACGQVVPVPETLASSAAEAREAVSAGCESPTQELTAADTARIQSWAAGFGPNAIESPAATPAPASAPPPPPPPPPTPAGSTASASGLSPSPVRVEAGLRVCPRCGRPVHLGSDSCRQCGASVPKR